MTLLAMLVELRVDPRVARAKELEAYSRDPQLLAEMTMALAARYGH